jgi:hypothetical protein
MKHRPPPAPDVVDEDRIAIQLMLAYVEAECRRLGAEGAAHHAALAASLLPGGATPLERATAAARLN